MLIKIILKNKSFLFFILLALSNTVKNKNTEENDFPLNVSSKYQDAYPNNHTNNQLIDKCEKAYQDHQNTINKLKKPSDTFEYDLLYSNKIDLLPELYLPYSESNIEMEKNFCQKVMELNLELSDYYFNVLIRQHMPGFFENATHTIDPSAKYNTKFNKYYTAMTQEQRKKFIKKLKAGSTKYFLSQFKTYSKLIGILIGGIGTSYIVSSFTSNLLQNISNNLIQPFFNRWGKHKNFLVKLKFEHIKNYNLSNLAGYKNLIKIFSDIAEELIEQKTTLTKMEGICLFGEPGNGKTQLVKALAGQAEVPIVIVNLNTLLNESGHIEENINLLFEEVRKKAPCILLLDEFDLITGSRKLGKLTDSEKSILNELLQQLDGTNALKGVLVIANTNIIDNIDFALKRPGRLGRVIEVPAPTQEDIRDIIALYLKELKINYNISFIEYITEKISSLKTINVASIKNYIEKIAKYCIKNNIKKIKNKDYDYFNKNIFIDTII